MAERGVEANGTDARSKSVETVHKCRGAINFFGMVAVNEAGVDVKDADGLRPSRGGCEEQHRSIWDVKIIVRNVFIPEVGLAD
jgi:hypothetical protein